MDLVPPIVTDHLSLVSPIVHGDGAIWDEVQIFASRSDIVPQRSLPSVVPALDGIP
jgi:hypothetical protein